MLIYLFKALCYTKCVKEKKVNVGGYVYAEKAQSCDYRSG